MSTTHYNLPQSNVDKFSFELKSPVEFIRPEWKVEEESPFSMCEDYESERRRRMLGISAFRRMEEEERQRRILEIERMDTVSRREFSPSLVYTVIEEEMERQRRMKELDEEMYKERVRSRNLTTRFEEQERADRIKNLFQEEVIARKKNAAVTKDLEEAERRRRINDMSVIEKRNFTASTSRMLMPSIQSVLRNNSLRPTERTQELKLLEETESIRRSMREERKKMSDRTGYLEEEERRRRMAEGDLNMFKAKEMSKVIMREVLENNLFKKLSGRRRI